MAASHSSVCRLGLCCCFLFPQPSLDQSVMKNKLKIAEQTNNADEILLYIMRQLITEVCDGGVAHNWDFRLQS